MSEPKPATPQGESAAAERNYDAVCKKILGLVALIVASRSITCQPPQLNALVQGLLIAVMAALIVSMISGLFGDLRGRTGMDRVETAAAWVGAVLGTLIAVGLIYGLFAVIDTIAGPTIVRLLGQLGLIS